jgi:hypothetical protein
MIDDTKIQINETWSFTDNTTTDTFSSKFSVLDYLELNGDITKKYYLERHLPSGRKSVYCAQFVEDEWKVWHPVGKH